MGGTPPPTAVAPDVKVQAVQGSPVGQCGRPAQPLWGGQVSGGGPACRWCGRGGPKRRATRGGWWAPARGGNSEGVHLCTG